MQDRQLGTQQLLEMQRIRYGIPVSGWPDEIKSLGVPEAIACDCLAVSGGWDPLFDLHLPR